MSLLVMLITNISIKIEWISYDHSIIESERRYYASSCSLWDGRHTSRATFWSCHDLKIVLLRRKFQKNGGCEVAPGRKRKREIPKEFTYLLGMTSTSTGFSLREISSREISSREISLREISLREISLREISSREISSREISSREISLPCYFK